MLSMVNITGGKMAPFPGGAPPPPPTVMPRNICAPSTPCSSAPPLPPSLPLRQPAPGLRRRRGLGAGVLLKDAGSDALLGAVGISGASGDEDEYCALVGVSGVVADGWSCATEPAAHSCTTLPDVG